MTMIASDSSVDEDRFVQDVTAALSGFRATLSALIEAVAARMGTIDSAADLQRALGLRNTLAWQVYRLATADDPLAEAGSVPGRAAMKHFFDAAGQSGISNESIGAAQDAHESIESLVARHAGDRTTFQTMVSGLTRHGSNPIDSANKRAAFRANSHLWGVQACAQLSCFIYQPSTTDSAQIDAVGMRGLLELRRLRHDVPWVITSTRAADDDGVVRREVGVEPLDPQGVLANGACLMRRFCTAPLPALRSLPTRGGKTNIVLEPNGIGAGSALTCIVGNVFSGFCPRGGDEHNRALNSQTTVRTPCEMLIHDVLVHEDIAGTMASEAMIFGDHRDVDPACADRCCDLLSLREDVVYVGKGPAVLHTPHMSRYVEMVGFALAELGWDGERFRVYRCRMAYPVMPSSVVVTYTLAE